MLTVRSCLSKHEKWKAGRRRRMRKFQLVVLSFYRDRSRWV